jgi:hypothetical protein
MATLAKNKLGTVITFSESAWLCPELHKKSCVWRLFTVMAVFYSLMQRHSFLCILGCRTGQPSWESIPEPLKRFINTGSVCTRNSAWGTDDSV